MNLGAVFRPEAVADVVEARGWYEEQDLGLGDAFAASVEAIVNRIEVNAANVSGSSPRCEAWQTAKVSVLGLLPSASEQG